jgi:hypothetical protein
MFQDKQSFNLQESWRVKRSGCISSIFSRNKFYVFFLLPPVLQHVYSINKIKVIKCIDKTPKLWWGTDVFVCYKLNLLHKFKLIFIFSYPGVVKSSCGSSSNGDWKTVKQINFITSISRYKHNNIPCYNCKYSQTCPNGHLCIVVTWS